MASIAVVPGLMSITLLVVVSITDTVPLPVLATYSRVPLTATELGEEPTEIGLTPKALGLVSITLWVVVSITDTVPLPVLATYSRVPLTATELGEEPTEIGLTPKALGLVSITL